MSTPSFDPSQFLNQIGVYDPNTGSVTSSDFTFSVDPSTGTTGVPLTSNVANPISADVQGLIDEWTTRTKFGDSPPGTGTDYAAFQSQIAILLNKWSSTNVDPNDRLPFPQTWGDFITQFRKFFGIANTNVNSGPAYNGFLTAFKAILKTDTDWASLNPNTVDAEFIDSFSGFLKSYPLNSGLATNVQPAPIQFAGFINNWRHFNTVTAVVDPNTTIANITPVDYSNLLSYKEAYKAFFPNSTDADFTLAMQTFQNEVNNDPNNGGYFVPSQQFARFFSEIKSKLLVLQAASATDYQPKLEIIWQVFATILEMIGIIQKVTAISAQRLSFLTNYQTAYTDLIAKIPTLLNNQPFDSDNTSQLNAKLQAFADSLRSYRGVVSDSSKSLQSSVNGLNESGTQQSNLASNILQQMNSLLSTIMK